ncbi:MAG: phosphatidate cytidylyltransferase [Planctomycetota bacterium]|nr:phosphatidate cytidylyltransferase [Planctomycetota bacterium]
MRERLLLGPLLILLLVGGLALDQWLDARPLPSALRVIGSDTVPPGVIVFVVMAILGALAARELAAILAANGVLASRRVTTFAAMCGLLASGLIPGHATGTEAFAGVGTAGVLALITALGFYSRHRSVEGVVAGTGGALLAFVYIGLMLGFLLAIRREHTAWILLWVLMVTKACDIGALFAGKAFGRHKLIPWLSPGKTWEGLVGGVVLAALVAWGGFAVIHAGTGAPVPGVFASLGAGVVLGLVGQAGDLLESLLKRDAGIKDSGRSLPGFGGVLDLIDSPLLAAPVAYWMLHSFQRIATTHGVD